MDAFLHSIKEKFCAARWRWKLIACGSRQMTFDAFLDGCRTEKSTVHILLVDSEDLLGGADPRRHLEQRDGWQLGSFDPNQVHLMVCTMETWLTADPKALTRFYGNGFLVKALPKAQDLEAVEKKRIEASLKRATRKTQKGEYLKIGHGPELLSKLDAAKVRGRCQHCERLFVKLPSFLE